MHHGKSNMESDTMEIIIKRPAGVWTITFPPEERTTQEESRLMDAAPDLLAACEAFLRVWNSSEDDTYDDVGWLVVKAIDKAMGAQIRWHGIHHRE